MSALANLVFIDRRRALIQSHGFVAGSVFREATKHFRDNRATQPAQIAIPVIHKLFKTGINRSVRKTAKAGPILR